MSAAPEVTVTKIGSIDQGIDGRDDYFLLDCKSDNMNPSEAIDHMVTNFHWIGFPNFSATRAPKSMSKVICIVEYRNDN